MYGAFLSRRASLAQECAHNHKATHIRRWSSPFSESIAHHPGERHSPRPHRLLSRRGRSLEKLSQTSELGQKGDLDGRERQSGRLQMIDAIDCHLRCGPGHHVIDERPARYWMPRAFTPFSVPTDALHVMRLKDMRQHRTKRATPEGRAISMVSRVLSPDQSLLKSTLTSGLGDSLRSALGKTL